ncbi:homocysteine S-methyltransferase family protein [Olsenella sp. YH-ols2217]|uniref:Methionine synthase n=1 Tax=Kribbibacterium absianum TaxID=3044210 RepID=A0ABT6ZLP4_9ACTN|nr:MULTISPECIES: homocysteine S-methyltransferase family protein [unclassified Olsenella]MDJ1121721.1 homocysteine S-methyltransferase family protein [Olsenella sp. YH-ols2216]MDJ1129729.1 homocysteine S-methyltransferase family protein [Olsenella sp. YH-ols2217]
MPSTESARAALDAALRGEGFLLFDGAMGTMLQARGLAAGEEPERLLFERPEVVASVHEAYAAAGAHVATTNTFGANRRKLPGDLDVRTTYRRAVEVARQAGAPLVAADIGPTGALLEPFGPMTLDECEEVFREQAAAVACSGADLVVLETFGDLLELKTALLAVRAACDLPVLATMTFGDDGRTFLGVTPEAAAVTLSSLGVAAVGVNCSQGPDGVAAALRAMAPYTRVPLMAQANAGLPRTVDGRTVYDLDASAYAAGVAQLVDAGATIIGGCCGATDAHIAQVRELLEGCAPAAPARVPVFSVASADRVVTLPERGTDIAVVGERINPTGRKAFREALAAGDLDCVLDEAEAQAAAGAQLLDVNCGVPGADEPALLESAVKAIQAVCDVPLVLDSSDPVALERACRCYTGKPLINSVNLSSESVASVLPVAARYGAALIALCIDDDGVPATADARVAIAHRLVERIEAAGIPAQDVAVDCLTMTISASPDRARPVLDALSRVRRELPVQAALGVSNISFGLPSRRLVNASFLLEALACGLTLPIVDPLVPEMANALDAHRALTGQDVGLADWIERHANDVAAQAPVRAAKVEQPDAAMPDEPDAVALWVQDMILRGRKNPVAAGVARLLEAWDPGAVADATLIPALDEAGRRFEAKTFFLPQLMAAAEASGAGFDLIKAATPPDETPGKGSVILATVKGDVHDIGKNIVGMLLANRGFAVTDLGRDVAPEAVLAAVRDTGVTTVGLSALMTTTVPAMAETVELLHREVPDAFVFVGGAVLTPELAEQIGADAYAKDAAESARLLEDRR